MRNVGLEAELLRDAQRRAESEKRAREKQERALEKEKRKLRSENAVRDMEARILDAGLRRDIAVERERVAKGRRK